MFGLQFEFSWIRSRIKHLITSHDRKDSVDNHSINFHNDMSNRVNRLYLIIDLLNQEEPQKDIINK